MTIYLDHAGIGLVRPAARAAMHDAIDEVLANGSGQYARFFAARTAARTAAATLLDCDPDEVALVANTSTALQLVADGLDWRTGQEVVVFDGDFPANVQPWRRLVERGVRLRWVPMRDGGYDLADIEAALVPATRLVAVSHVNFLTGFRLDLDAICSLAAPLGALVCVDAAQSLGAVPLSVARTPVDFLAAGGHKWLGAPPGTGILYCRRDRLELLRRAPLGWFGYDRSDAMFAPGGVRVEYELSPRPAARRFEGGMLNFVGIVGLAAALDELSTVGLDVIWPRVRTHTDLLRAGLRERGYVVAGPPRADAAVAGIVSFTPRDRASAHERYERLLRAGCQCSCPAGWIRLSPHNWTSREDITAALELLPAG